MSSLILHGLWLWSKSSRHGCFSDPIYLSAAYPQILKSSFQNSGNLRKRRKEWKSGGHFWSSEGSSRQKRSLVVTWTGFSMQVRWNFLCLAGSMQFKINPSWSKGEWTAQLGRRLKADASSWSTFAFHIRFHVLSLYILKCVKFKQLINAVACVFKYTWMIKQKLIL